MITVISVDSPAAAESNSHAPAHTRVCVFISPPAAGAEVSLTPEKSSPGLCLNLQRAGL